MLASIASTIPDNDAKFVELMWRELVCTVTEAAPIQHNAVLRFLWNFEGLPTVAISFVVKGGLGRKWGAELGSDYNAVGPGIDDPGKIGAGGEQVLHRLAGHTGGWVYEVGLSVFNS